MTGVVQEVVGKRSNLVRLHYGGEKEIQLNHITAVVVRSELEEQIEVREVEMIPEVGEELGCYHWVYISLLFIKEYGVDKREQQVGVELDHDEEEIEYGVPNDERDFHWRMVFYDKMQGWRGRSDNTHVESKTLSVVKYVINNIMIAALTGRREDG